MKVVGIIAEYNPFHRGHEYQIRYARESLGADYVIVAMSGDFVQRGAPALMPKHLRAEMALLGGADLDPGTSRPGFHCQCGGLCRRRRKPSGRTW